MVYYFTSQKDTKCRLMNPVINNLQKNYDINVLDINYHKKLVKNFKIDSLPALVRGGDRLFGVKSKETIISFLRR